MQLDDVLARTALDQAALVRRGEISCEELVRACLDRITAANGELQAFTQVLADEALAEARRKDRKRSDGSPFFGVPIGVKDLNFVRGAFTRMGSRAFARLLSPFDDRTVKSLRAGGFVVIGKTATSELGTLPVTEPDIHPPTRNPIDPRFTSGGSSGGAGAAVASGMIAIAHGSDGAGSVRIPASFCGLVGHKPSRGRVPNAYGLPDEHALYTCGPLAKSVDDAAAFLDVVSGVTSGKPHWAVPPPAPFADLARRPPPRLRVRFTTHTSFADTDPEVARAVIRTVKTLEGLGHHVEQGVIAEGSAEEFVPVWQHATANIPVPDWTVVQPLTRWLAAHGRGLTADDVAARIERLGAQVLAWFGDADLWVTPTVPVRPPRVGAWRALTPEATLAEAARIGPFTAPFNASGQPALSFPAGKSADGLPIGVQLVGQPLADGLVLAVARQLEEAMA